MNDVPKPADDGGVFPPRAENINEPERLLRLDHVLDRVPVSSIGRAAFWRESSLTAWIEEQTSAA